MSQEIADAIHQAVQAAIPDATIEVTIGSPGHYSLDVTSAQFEGKRLLDKQRMVLSPLKDLMAGDQAPVHAIDTIKTHVPG